MKPCGGTRDALRAGAAACACALAAHLLVTRFDAAGIPIMLWPGAGFALAAMLLGGPRHVFAAVLGTGIAVAAARGAPEGVIATLRDGAEALLAARLLRRPREDGVSLATLSGHVTLLVRGTLSVAVCTLLAVSAAHAAGFITTAAFPHRLAFDTMAGTAGIAIVTPLVLVWRHAPTDWRHGSRPLEAILLAAVTLLVGGIVFLHWLDPWLQPFGRTYWMFLLVTLAAVRLGHHGTLAVVALTCIEALLGTLHGTAQFAGGLTAQLVNLWLSLIVLTVIGCLQAAALAARQRDAAALREREDTLKQAERIAGIGSWQADLVRGEYLSSPEAARILGWSDAGPRPLAAVLETVPPDERERLAAAWRAACDGGAYEVEHRIVRAGEERWLRVSAELHRDASGQPLSALGVIRDVTRDHHAEHALAAYRDRLEELVEARTTALRAQTAEIETLNAALARRAEEAEAANRAKSAFFANMSHEIRTPLNTVIGLTHLLRRRLREPDQIDKLGKIAEAADHLLSIINDILDISKIEANRISLESADFALDTVMRNVCSLTLEKANAKGLELVVDIDPRLTRMLRGDPLRLGQALLNYVSNAVKFTSRGSVVIRARIVSEQGSNLLVRFEVQDTGIGISHEAQARLFAPFEQAERATTRRFSGTGLGLAINRRLAALMGGEVGFESEPGVGSLFWFTAQLVKSGQDAKPRLIGHLKGRRALVADDLPEARTVAAEILRSLGVRVEEYDSGHAALAAVERADRSRDRFEFALIDWRMPDMDGLETAQRLHAMKLHQPPLVLLVTAYDEAELRPQARAAGVSLVLGKPLTPSTLHDSLLRLLGIAEAAPRDPLSSPTQQVLLRDYEARILVAEDNPVNQEVVHTILANAGFDVDLADTGARAVALARDNHYDLILMDLQMPELDGLEATRAIRRLPAHLHTPILAMTASLLEEDVARCLEAGMNDHLGKTLDPERLFEALAKWLPERARKAPPHGETPAGQLAPRLLNTEALDAPTGLRNVGGRAETYLMLLKLFASHHQDDVRAIRDLFAAGRYTPLKRLVHAIHGAAGTLGALRVAALGHDLEMKLNADHAPADLAAAISAFTVAHDALLAEIHALPAPSQETERLDPQALADLLQQFDQLLADDDFAATELLRRCRNIMQSSLGTTAVQAFAAQIEAFDFQGARQTLQLMRSAARVTAEAPDRDPA